MRVLVTGVNGLVGTSIAKLLSQKKYNISTINGRCTF